MAPKRIAAWTAAAGAALAAVVTVVKTRKPSRTALKDWRNNATTAVKTATDKVSEKVAPAKGHNNKSGLKR